MHVTFPHTMRHLALTLGRLSVILAIFFSPISKPPTNIFLFFALIFSLVGSDLTIRFRSALKNPVTVGSIVWFCVLFLFAFHPEAPQTSWETLGAYKTILYIIFIASLLTNMQWRTYGIYAFAVSSGLILLASWAEFLFTYFITAKPEVAGLNDFVIFKDYTQQGIAFLVLAVFCLSFGSYKKTLKQKYCYWSVAVLALANVVFLLQSRTSYLIIAPLLLYGLLRIAKNRRTKIALAISGMLVFAAASLFSPRLQERLIQSSSEISSYSENKNATSLGIRLELWKRTMPIIMSAPWFGHGLGSWTEQFAMQAKNLPEFSPFRRGHPHEEYLLILAEQGIIGFSVYLTLLLLLFIYIRHIEYPFRDFYTCLILIYLTAGLANCLMIDFSHRHRFILLLACIPPLSKHSRKPIMENSSAS